MVGILILDFPPSQASRVHCWYAYLNDPRTRRSAHPPKPIFGNASGYPHPTYAATAAIFPVLSQALQLVIRGPSRKRKRAVRRILGIFPCLNTEKFQILNVELNRSAGLFTNSDLVPNEKRMKLQ
jgi:hypothetical protein